MKGEYMAKEFYDVKYVAKCYAHTDRYANGAVGRCETNNIPFSLKRMMMPKGAYLIELFEKVKEKINGKEIERITDPRFYYIGEIVKAEDIIPNVAVKPEEAAALQNIECNGFVKVASGRYYPLYNGCIVLNPKDFKNGIYHGKIEDICARDLEAYL